MNATSTPCNFLEYPTDIVLLVVRWHLRYTLSLRDLAEMFLERGLDRYLRPRNEAQMNRSAEELVIDFVRNI